MEAIADCKLWFWHVSIFNLGSLNEFNILWNGSTMQRILSGQLPTASLIISTGMSEICPITDLASEGTRPNRYVEVLERVHVALDRVRVARDKPSDMAGNSHTEDFVLVDACKFQTLNLNEASVETHHVARHLSESRIDFLRVRAVVIGGGVLRERGLVHAITETIAGLIRAENWVLGLLYVHLGQMAEFRSHPVPLTPNYACLLTHKYVLFATGSVLGICALVT